MEKNNEKNICSFKYCIIVIIFVLIRRIKYGKTFFTDSEISKKTFEQIIESIYDKDSETLKGMFSKTAIMASKDIDANLTDLFNFYNGEYITYDDIGGPMVTDERNADGTGGKRKELQI